MRYLYLVVAVVISLAIGMAFGTYQQATFAGVSQKIDSGNPPQRTDSRAIAAKMNMLAKKAVAAEKAQVVIVPVAMEPAIPTVSIRKDSEKRVVVNFYHDKHQKQMLVCYEREKEVFRCLISAAKTDIDLPPGKNMDGAHNHIGTFHVFEKDPDYWSTTFNCPMKNSAFYWGKHAIHACIPPKEKGLGKPHSDGGCVNVSDASSQWIFRWIRKGTEVKCIREKW